MMRYSRILRVGLTIMIMVGAFVGLATYRGIKAEQPGDLPTLYWGSVGPSVSTVQARLSQWGYYLGPIDGIYLSKTAEAVRRFQWRNGLSADGVVGPKTWAALGFAAASRTAPSRGASRAGASWYDSVDLLARLIAAEAHGEPYAGEVAVAAVVLNRVENPSFPNTLAGVVFQPDAFESVSNGLYYSVAPNAEAYSAARDALNGFDPTYGALFFWNPGKPVGPWIWTRPIITTIGRHVFAR